MWRENVYIEITPNIFYSKLSTMNVPKSFLLYGGLLLLMSSCSPSLSPFTQKLYDQNDWTETDLREIQFYLSSDILLRREVKGGRSDIRGGEIKMMQGVRIEEVAIPRGTPGVFVFSPKSNRFAVSFEDGRDDQYLMFGPNPKVDGRYVLLASEWGRRNGTVNYAGKKWKVNSDDAFASLMVDLKKVRKFSMESRVARGRTID